MKVSHLFVVMLMASMLVACGGGSSGSSTITPPPMSAAPTPTSTSAPTTTMTPSPTPTTSVSAPQVTLNGKITFDNVPHNDQGLGLDYSSTFQAPARGVVVSLVDANNNVIDQTITNQNGDYEFTVASSINIKVQAFANLLAPTGRDWDVKVTDNTSDNALYILAGSLSSSGTAGTQTRNLHAPSGWSGTSYTSERAAAPFAILNTIYDSIKTVEFVDPQAKFPALEIRWSQNNRAVLGDRSQGDIGTSGFFRDENVIYLLGEAGRDTDEYDPHVIVHEWGHYFEENLSRFDSMGGLHSLNARLDPRLAFSEGWSNALAAIVTGDPNYKDSSGPSQSTGLQFDFENLDQSNEGWFNEASVTSIIYDIFDESSDDADRISTGFSPIYKAVTAPAFREASAFATIFSFSESLLNQSDISVSDYRELLDRQSIASSDALGMGEDNNGSIESALPVYKEAQVNGEAVEVCSVDDAGNFNRLGNREAVFFDIPQDGNYVISMTLTSGDDQRDPDFNLWHSGEIVITVETTMKGEESFRGQLQAGRYVAETYDFFNINGTSDNRGDGCFNFQVTAG